MNQPPYYPPPGAPGAPGPPGGPTPRRSNTVVIIIVVVVASVFGCGIFSALGFYGFRRYLERARAAASISPVPGAPVAAGSGGASPSSPTVVNSTDGHSQMTLPTSWKLMPELGEEGVIRAADVRAAQFLIVITESKVDFAVQVDLAKYGEIVTGGMQQKLVNAEVGSPTALTIGGRPAQQYEVYGTVDFVNLGYLVTVIDGVEHYHQVLAWTSKSKLSSSRASFQRTVATFRER